VITPNVRAAARDLVREAQRLLIAYPTSQVARDLLKAGEFVAAGAEASHESLSDLRDALQVLLVRELDSSYPPTYDAAREAGKKLARLLPG
jgi:hypothetical protein